MGVLLSAFASGKTALKNLTQFERAGTVGHAVPQSSGKQPHPDRYYFLLYLNEVLCRLLAKEDSAPMLFLAYHRAVVLLDGAEGSTDDGDNNGANIRNNQPPAVQNDRARLALRQFESALFDHLGVAHALTATTNGEKITTDGIYRLNLTEGWAPENNRHAAEQLASGADKLLFWGSDLLAIDRWRRGKKANLTAQTGAVLARLHRLLMDDLLAYQPLNARKLWQQRMRLRNNERADWTVLRYGFAPDD